VVGREGVKMARTRVEIDGRTAFVSGAASGIGRAVAVRLAAHGCPLAIVDRDQPGLERTAELIGGPVLTRQLDVRDRQAQLTFAAEVAEWAPAPLGMVFNNAGVATAQTIAEAAIEDDEWVHQVNYGGVVNGTHAFLPTLLRQDSGVIVNTSSVFGLVGIPGQSAYCASKFAVRGFTDSLRQELRGTGVRAICVHPGGVTTNIARNARFHSHPTRHGVSREEAIEEFDRITMTTPERAARVIHNGVKAGRSRVLVGPDAYLFDFLARTMPTHYYTVLARVHAVGDRISRSSVSGA
jgi:NADP-dependent 3-hydroxy acid dehydrogenase YdfG